MFGLEKIAPKIEVPPAGVGADLAIPCFQESPEEVAEKIRALDNPLFGDVAIKGRYVNISFNLATLAPFVLNEVVEQKEKYGWNNSGAGKTILLEYSSPNIAKPMHMGHARNNAIGHSLARLYDACGYDVLTMNFVGDWGMSLAKIMLAYQKWGDEEAFAKDPIRHSLDLYMRVTEETVKNLALEDEARVLFKRLATGDMALRTLWQKFCDVSIADFRRVYDLLDIDFDVWNGESFYEQFIPAVIDEALAKGVATQAEGGPVVVDFNDPKLPPFLLRKSDGASLYGARDLAVAKWRLENYDAEKIVYVVGHEQELYLKQIFKTLGKMGYPEEKFIHIPYGVVTLEGKKISTRAGNIVFLEEILAEAITKSKGIKEVGVGAIIYNMLSMGREHDIAFSWDAALSVQGNSAPYIQYAYVRATAILRNAQDKFLEKPNSNSEAALKTKNYKLKTASHEDRLIKHIAQYPEAVRQAQALNAPHIVATFLNNFTQEFNRFYDTVPVLEAGENRAFLLSLVAAVAQVVKNGLWLLGIAVPERM